MAARALDLLDVSGEVRLEELEPMTHITTKLRGKFAQLFPCFPGNEQFVSHGAGGELVNRAHRFS
jgi:hypothetical protein